MIGKRHRVYGCGSRFGCKCQERVFREGDLIAFLYFADEWHTQHERGDLGILIKKTNEEEIVDEKDGNKWKLIDWTVFHQKSGKYQEVTETEFDFAEDLGVHHD